jgi:hypothetical protein
MPSTNHDFHEKKMKEWFVAKNRAFMYVHIEEKTVDIIGDVKNSS